MRRRRYCISLELTPTRTATATKTEREQAELLISVLKREAERGYDNGAVVGGFDGLWHQFAAIEDAVRELRPVKGQRYASLLPHERRAWHNAVVKWRATRERATRSDTAANTQRSDAAGADSRQSDYPTAPRLPKGSGIDTRLADLKHIHHRSRKTLELLGLTTVRDALRHYPLRHIDYSVRTPILQLMPGVEATVVGEVTSTRHNRHMRPPGASTTIRDGSGALRVSWFNMPFMADRWKVGDRVVFSGLVGEYKGKPTMTNPEYDDLTMAGREVDRGLIHAGTLVPVYPLVDGTNQRSVRGAIFQVLEIGLESVRDALPDDIRTAHELATVQQAIRHLHAPRSRADLVAARRRMAFDECLYNQLAALRRRDQWKRGATGALVEPNMAAVESFIANLNFTLTGDQQDTLSTVLADIKSGEPMTRLIQGEVGSGKTVVAVTAMLSVVKGREPKQATLMAPTEVLAEQHFLNLINDLECSPAFGVPAPIYESQRINVGDHGEDLRPLRIGLLTGSLSERAKSAVREACANGQVEIVVGTHALLQESVEFQDLALVVVDEQQRFGTEQRATLTRRTPRPHLIAMSATPIPRTLHMVLYGDMDVSELKTLPHGRTRIATQWLRTPMEQAAAFANMREEITEGQQCFVVCPLIEPSDALDAAPAVEVYAQLRNGEFADYNVDLLHGRMSLTEKQEAMERFRNGATQVLVSTTVIEVGVDVPNATVMMVMSADRFGMSQLHQLRGRVGRGEHPGTCYLVADPESDTAKERIEALVRSSDGFALAAKDLEMRGPGRNLASEQSGWSGWKFANFTDLELIAEARAAAEHILREDPQMQSAKYRDLRRSMSRVIVDVPSEFA